MLSAQPSIRNGIDVYAIPYTLSNNPTPLELQAMTNSPPSALVQALLQDGLSQQEIAEAVGTTQPTISRIGAGEHKDPRSSVVDGLRKLAAERGVKPRETDDQATAA